jgi:hypothetical protein
MPTEFSSTIVDDSGDVHGQVTLAIGSAGAPVIAYTSQSGEVRLAEQNDLGEWIITRPPCGTASRHEYRISLDLDSRSEPHIALVNASTDHLVYGARGQQWTFEEVPTEGGLFPGRVRFPSMKLYKGFHELRDQFGRTPFEDSPYICYQAAQGILELRYAAKLRPRDNPAAEPVWKKHVETIDRGDPEFGWFAALDISPDDIIRIAYYADLTQLGFNKRLHLANMLNDPEIRDRPIRRGEEGWHRETLDGVAAELFGEPPSLALLISDWGAVSYVSRIGQMPRSLKLCRFGNFPESPAVELVTHDVGGSRSSVARSLSGKWCVAYEFNGRLMFATRTAPGAFAIENVEAGGGWPSMRFSDDGSALIAHVAGGTLQFVVATPDD